MGISIHALREEGDICKPVTAPPEQIISIHALREEGDYRHHGRRSSGAISIHALREEGDLLVLAGGVLAKVFLSTPSARRATEMSGQGSFVPTISIHALREEGDVF